MVWLSLLLTAVSVFAVGRLAAPIDVSCTDGDQTAYIPLGLRRVWSVAAGALSLLTWIVPTWPVFIAAMAGHLGAMVCRNARIVWSSRRFHITGALGLEWTYEYAQLRGFSRRTPLLRTNDRVFILWPGMVMQATFLQEAGKYAEVAARNQAWRKRGYADTKQNAANRHAVLTNIGLALCIAALLAFWYWPITAESGDVAQLVLTEAHDRLDNAIGLAFDSGRDYRVIRTEDTAALLAPDALNRRYTVQSLRRYTSRPSRNWYQVIAITDDQGNALLTWEESAQRRWDGLPAAAACGGIAWCILRKTGKVRDGRRRRHR